MDFSLPHLICFYGGAVKGSLHQVGQVQCAEARFEIAVFCEPDFAEAQGETNQAGGVNDEEVAIHADAVDVSVSGEDGYDSGQVFYGFHELLGVAYNATWYEVGLCFILGEDPGVNEQDEGAAVVVSFCSGFAQDAVVCFCPSAQTVFQWADGIYVGERQAQARRGFDDVQGFGDWKLSGKSFKAPFLGIAIVIARDVVCGRVKAVKRVFGFVYGLQVDIKGHFKCPTAADHVAAVYDEVRFAGVDGRYHCTVYFMAARQHFGRAEVFCGCGVVMAVCDEYKV